jgi:transposase
MAIAYVGVDLAKNVFHLHAVDQRGAVIFRCARKRHDWIEIVRERIDPEAVIAMEACASAHHWGRLLQSYGYEVRLVPGQFVKPFVKSNKNDFVAVKSQRQQDLQALHRVRDDVIQQRTAKANQIRGLSAEYGIVAPVGLNQLRKAIPEWLEDVDNGLSGLFRQILAGLHHDLVALDERVEVLTRSIQQVAESDPVAKRLLSLRGVGPLCATAMAIELGDGQQFRRGRDFAASLGLVPRQHSTGGKARLLGISKRGDAYTRKLLVHGARAVIRHHKVDEDPLNQWISPGRLREAQPINQNSPPRRHNLTNRSDCK